jgi:hypothetical protein
VRLAEHHFSEYGICPWMNFGGRGDGAVRGSMRRFPEKVLPRFR